MKPLKCCFDSIVLDLIGLFSPGPKGNVCILTGLYPLMNYPRANTILEKWI